MKTKTFKIIENYQYESYFLDVFSCPRCNSLDIDLIHMSYIGEDTEKHMVRCNNCLLTGKDDSKEIYAIDNWNKRSNNLNN